ESAAERYAIPHRATGAVADAYVNKEAGATPHRPLSLPLSCPLVGPPAPLTTPTAPTAPGGPHGPHRPHGPPGPHAPPAPPGPHGPRGPCPERARAPAPTARSCSASAGTGSPPGCAAGR